MFHHTHYSDLFNSIIHSLGLREIHLNGGAYTWSNNQTTPTLEKLDRVLMDGTWEDLFPLVTVHKLVRHKSDHNPLLLNTNVSVSRRKQRDFDFELSWLKDESFLPKVAIIWNQPVNKTDIIDVINIKLKKIKKYFKGWGSNVFGKNRKRRGDLKIELASIEEWEETTILTPELFGRKIQIQVELDALYADEELEWMQKSHQNWILKGDQNTAYFYRIANGRRRKNTIYNLIDDGVNIQGTTQL